MSGGGGGTAHPRIFREPQLLTYTLDDVKAVIRASELSDYHKDKLTKKLRDLPPWGMLPESLQWNLCRVKLCRGEWDWLGWGYRSDWSKRVRALSPMPLWDGRKCKLLVIAEEGVGDEVMAASCFDELFEKNPDTVVECDARLIRVFRRTWGDRFVPRVTSWEAREGEMMLPMLDLFPWFRKSPSACPGVPYLKRPKVQDTRYKIGVAWSGRHGKINLRPIPGAVSLQYGCGVDWAQSPGIDPIEQLDDLIDLIAGLERVVSCPQSVVHIAGAFGVPTTVIMPQYGSGQVRNVLHWRYECGLPFYNSATVYRNWESAKSSLRCLLTGTNDMESGSLSRPEICRVA